jgi:ABC-type sugar transport system ATPase subunit
VLVEVVVKRFGTVTTMHDLTIEIADCVFVTLARPSGCGDS